VLIGSVRHYWGNWKEVFAGVRDPRNPNLIIYPVESLLFTGVHMFITQLGARRGIKDWLRDNELVAAKMEAWFRVANTPHGDTLNYTYRRLDVAEVQEVVCRCVETLIRKKVLYRYRLLGMHYTVAIDGTGVLTFHQRHCPHCLTKTLRNGEILYYHPVLEAKLVTPNGFAFSLMTEFIENADLSQSKQDCESKAFGRLAKRLKARFPRLPMCLLLDGLYADGPTFQICENYDWKYLIVLQEADLPNLHRSFAAVTPHLPNQRKHVCLPQTSAEKVEQKYVWAEDLAYVDSQKRRHSLSLIECQETSATADQSVATTHYKWVTNFTLTAHNVDILANQGGRLRWKIENEGFNVQKNSDLNLEHAYSEDEVARKIFYLLLQLACIFFQIMQKSSLLLEAFPDRLRTAKNLARRILEAWRNLSLNPDEFLALGEGNFQIRFDTS
jgi:hypothetical protein